jgi:peptidoglycan/xylan/chitin deacetylase (PgdA/CDA1 family)
VSTADRPGPRIRASRDILFLAYHAVSERWPADLSVTPERLDAQLALLTARGYRGATFHRAVTDPPPGRTVVVTFDDAFRSVLTLGLPILRRHGLPATIFAPTDHIGTGEPMRWPGIDRWHGGEHEAELMPLDWSELRALADAGWEVGSHTLSHPHLTRIDDARLDDELRRSREVCERELSLPCRTLAYPYGDHDARVVAAARAAGYQAACTLPEDFRSEGALRVPRVGVYHGDGDGTFRMKVSPAIRRARRSPLWPAASRAARLARARVAPGSASPRTNAA